MARAELTLQTSVRTGLNPTYSSAATDGHAVNNASHKVLLHVKNASGSSMNVTVSTPNTVDGNAISEKVVAVPNGEDRMIGPYPHAVYCKNDTTLSITHAIWVDYSATTSVTVAAIKLPDPTY